MKRDYYPELTDNVEIYKAHFKNNYNLTDFNFEDKAGKGLPSIEIPQNATRIGSYAYYNSCKSSDITLPQTVQVIGTYAFKGVEIPNITYKPKAYPIILNDDVFEPRTYETRYKLTVPFDSKNKYIERKWTEDLFNITEDNSKGGYIRENLKAGNWGTICLPFDVEERSTQFNVDFYVIDAKEEGAITLVELEERQHNAYEKVLEAGKPYFFKVKADGDLKLPYQNWDEEVDNSVSTTTAVNGLHGMLTAGIVDAGVYMLKNNTLYKAASGSSCAANRAYVVLSEVPTTSASAAPAATRVRMNVVNE